MRVLTILAVAAVGLTRICGELTKEDIRTIVKEEERRVLEKRVEGIYRSQD